MSKALRNLDKVLRYSRSDILRPFTIFNATLRVFLTPFTEGNHLAIRLGAPPCSTLFKSDFNVS